MRFHPTHGSMTLSVKDGGLPPDDVVRTKTTSWPRANDSSTPSRPVTRRHDPHRARPVLAVFGVAEADARQPSWPSGSTCRLHARLAENAEDGSSIAAFGRRCIEQFEDVGWRATGAGWPTSTADGDEITRLGQAGVGVAPPSSSLILALGHCPGGQTCGVPAHRSVGLRRLVADQSASLWLEPAGPAAGQPAAAPTP